MNRAHFVHLHQKRYITSCISALIRQISGVTSRYSIFDLAPTFKGKHSTFVKRCFSWNDNVNSYSVKLLNYLIFIAKLYLWNSKRSQILPNIYGFKKNIAVKYETEKYLSLHSKKNEGFL